jgi:hypothetical protein
MKKNNGLIEIGDYVSFDDTNEIIYKVLDIREFPDMTYILYKDVEDFGEEVWERMEYVTNVFKIRKQINCEEA